MKANLKIYNPAIVPYPTLTTQHPSKIKIKNHKTTKMRKEKQMVRDCQSFLLLYLPCVFLKKDNAIGFLKVSLNLFRVKKGEESNSDQVLIFFKVGASN